MKKDSKHILFITPSLASTGSEILLFHFINFLANHFSVSVICYKKGNLIDSLNKSVKVHVVNYEEPKTILQKILRRLKLYFVFPYLFNKYKKYQWYINTIVLPIPVEFAVKYNVNFFLHVHELEHMYKFLSIEQLNRAINKPKLLIANSTITKNHLIKAGSSQNLQIITPFIDATLIESFKVNRSIKIQEQFCWIMAGSIDDNKNPNLFIKIAIEAKNKNLPYKFIWLYNSITDYELFSDINKQLVSKNLLVQFIKTNNYNDYLTHFSKADGLLLTSTFESFSMITLEALVLEMSIVVNDCGGVNEIINHKIASVIPINSEIDLYLKAMSFELERINLLRVEKNKIAQSFDKDKILRAWEKLMITAI